MTQVANPADAANQGDPRERILGAADDFAELLAGRSPAEFARDLARRRVGYGIADFGNFLDPGPRPDTDELEEEDVI